MSSKRTARDCVSHFRRHSIGHQEYSKYCSVLLYLICIALCTTLKQNTCCHVCAERQSEEQVGSRDHNNDLVYMKGPLTEDALNRILASRFSQSHRSVWEIFLRRHY